MMYIRIYYVAYMHDCMGCIGEIGGCDKVEHTQFSLQYIKIQTKNVRARAEAHNKTEFLTLTISRTISNATRI